jgi:hypothetical protein
MGYQQADFDALLRLTSAPAAATPLPGRPLAAPVALSSQHIAGPDADRLLWQHVTETSESVQDLLCAAAAAPAFGPLLTDVFNLFFKTSPTLRDPQGVDPAVRQNRSWVENIMNAEPTATTRRLTQRDDLASALAPLAAVREIWQAILELLRTAQSVLFRVAEAVAAGLATLTDLRQVWTVAPAATADPAPMGDAAPGPAPVSPRAPALPLFAARRRRGRSPGQLSLFDEAI